MREDILIWGIQKDLGEIQSLRNGFVSRRKFIACATQQSVNDRRYHYKLWNRTRLMAFLGQTGDHAFFKSLVYASLNKFIRTSP